MRWRQPMNAPFNQAPPTQKKRGLGTSVAVAAIFAALVIGSASYFMGGHRVLAQLQPEITVTGNQ
jgi:uncharacterized protein HemX